MSVHAATQADWPPTPNVCCASSADTTPAPGGALSLTALAAEVMAKGFGPGVGRADDDVTVGGMNANAGPDASSSSTRR